MSGSISPSSPNIAQSATQGLTSSGVTSPKWYILQHVSGDSLTGISGTSATYNAPALDGVAKVRAEEEFYNFLSGATSNSDNSVSGSSGNRAVSIAGTDTIGDYFTWTVPTSWNTGASIGWFQSNTGITWYLLGNGHCVFNGGASEATISFSAGDLIKFRLGTSRVVEIYVNGTLAHTFATAEGTGNTLRPDINWGNTATYIHPELFGSGWGSWNYGESVITVGVAPDTTDPTVSVTGPSDGDTVNGNSVSVVVSCSDDTGVISLQLQIDGVDEGSPYTGSGITSHTFTWDSTGVDDGDHDINVVAEDAASNSATSSPITVTVHNINKISVICGIDSLSIDIDTVAYPDFLQVILDEKYPNQYSVSRQAGVGGDGFFNAYDGRKADDVYAFINLDAPRNVFICLGGINDIFATHTASELYTKVAAEVAEAQGMGLEVWVAKLMPQAYALHYPGSVTVVNAYNAMLDATPIGDKIIDFGLIPAMSDPNNAQYFRPDLLHPTNDGNRAMAEYAASLFNPGIDFDLDTTVSIFDTAIPVNNSDGYKFLDWKVNEVVKASQILPVVDYPDLSVFCKKDFSNKIELVGTNLVGDTDSQIKHLAYTQDTLDKGVGEVPFNQIAKPGQRYLITVSDFDNADPPNVSSNSNTVDITIPAKTFSPKDLSIVKCFIDPNQIEASNNDLIVPQDLSGHSNHFTQSTSGFKPKFKTNICNGKPMLLFDEVDDFLNFPNLSSFTAGRIYSLIIRTDQDTGQLWDFGGTTPAYPQGSEQNVYENFGLVGDRYVFQHVFSLLYPHIYSVAAGAGTAESYINGYQLGNASSITFGISATSYLGKGAAAVFCGFYQGPLIICDAKPSDDDDIRIMGWLRDWGNLAF